MSLIQDFGNNHGSIAVLLSCKYAFICGGFSLANYNELFGNYVIFIAIGGMTIVGALAVEEGLTAVRF